MNDRFGALGRRYYVSVSTPAGRRSIAICIAAAGIVCYATEVPRLSELGLGMLFAAAVFATWRRRS